MIVLTSKLAKNSHKHEQQIDFRKDFSCRGKGSTNIQVLLY